MSRFSPSIHRLLLALVFLALVIVSIMHFALRKTPEDILLGKSFYYMEPCEDEVYIDTFGKDSFIEAKETESGHRVIVPIVYKKDKILVRDGIRLFPCTVISYVGSIEIACEYEKERGAYVLYRSREESLKHRPLCEGNSYTPM